MVLYINRFMQEKNVLVCVCVCVCLGDDSWYFAHTHDIRVEHYSQNIKLYRPMVLLKHWLVWWQHKSLKLEMC